MKKLKYKFDWQLTLSVTLRQNFYGGFATSKDFQSHQGGLTVDYSAVSELSNQKQLFASHMTFCKDYAEFYANRMECVTAKRIIRLFMLTAASVPTSSSNRAFSERRWIKGSKRF